MSPSAVKVRRVADPADPAIPAFGRIQERTYPDPGSLIPPAYFPRMLTSRLPERRNLMVVAEDRAGDVVGGSVFHYFPGPNTGFSSFMAVAPEVRGRGVARAIHDARLVALDEEAGPEAPVHGIFIDVVAPERLTARELEQERRVGADPIARRTIFQRLGFRRVKAVYHQPVGGPGGGPVTNMDLLYCPRTPTDLVPADLVVETMRAYWLRWLGPELSERSARELRERCGGEWVRLLPADLPG